MSTPDVILNRAPYPVDLTEELYYLRKDPGLCSICCNLSAGTAYSLFPRPDIRMHVSTGVENFQHAQAQGFVDADESVPLWAGRSRTDFSSWQFIAAFEELVKGAATADADGQQGCPSCRLLVDGIVRACEGEVTAESTDVEVVVVFCRGDVLRVSVWRINADLGVDMFGEKLPSERTDIIEILEFYTLPGEPCPWPTIGSSMKREMPDDDSESLLGGPTRHIMAFPTVELTSKLAKRWLGECVETHSLCKERIDNHNSPLPKRVIDVGGDDNNSIHIFQPGDQQLDMEGQYVALSHCWGLSQHLTTTSHTIDQWKQNIPWKRLPRTFQEAIAVTRALGIQYIWIDSLCIVQDDIRDWEIEAENMGTIYHNALLVIAATASKDGDGGILFPRTSHKTITGRDERQRSFEIFVRGSCDHAVFSLDQKRDPGLEHSRTQSSFRSRFPLSTRAWCFQEHLLGTRILHFANDEMVFECLTSLNCECGSMTDFSDAYLLPSRRHVADRVMRPGSHGLEFIIKKPLARFRYAPRPDNAPIFDDWQRLTAEYSAKSITRSSDWLPALAGLASRWSSDDTGRYLAGVWSHDILRGLLWRTNTTGQGQDTRYIAPSWSWASVRRAVKWLEEGLDLPKYFVEIDSDKSDVVLKGQNRFGEVSKGWIFLTGEAKEATVKSMKASNVWSPVAFVEMEGKSQVVYVDDEKRCAELVGKKVLWLKYCQDKPFERALVLERIPVEQLEDLPSDIQRYPVVCRRVGIVEYVDPDIGFPNPEKVSMYII